MRLRVGLGALCFGFAVFAQAQSDPEVVRLGFAAPLSGPQAHYGSDMQHGLILALEQANAAQIQFDGKPVKFELVVRDDQADPKLAKTVAQQFVSAKLNGVLGHFNSGTSIAAAPIYHEHGLPQIAMASALAYTRLGFDTSFRMMGNDAQQGEALAQFMVKDLAASRVVVLHDNTAYGQGLSEQVVQATQRAHAHIVTDAMLSSSATDLSEQLAAIQQADAVFFAGTDRQAVTIKRTIAELGKKWSFITGDMGKTELFLDLSQEDGEGAYASLSGVPLDGLAAGRRFIQEYQQRFEQFPMLYAAYAYDGAWNMITAMKQANSAQPDVYLPYLASLKRSGVTSQSIAYDSQGNLRQSPFTIYQVRKGEWRMVKTLVSQARESSSTKD